MRSGNKGISFILEALLLKNLQRTGWLLRGAPRESVAEHVYGTAIIALILARMERLPAKDEHALLRIALLHDLHEARIGDLVPSQKARIRPDEARVEQEMLSGTLLSREAPLLRSKGRVAMLANDADRLDMLFRALENRKKGSARMGEFIKSALRQVKSKSGKELARRALEEG